MRLPQTRYLFLQLIIIWIIFDFLPRCCCFFESSKKLRMRRTLARRLNSLNFRKPFVCHREGYFPEGNGDGYFKCSRNPDGTFTRIRLRCLGGQSFDNALKRCSFIRGRRGILKYNRLKRRKPYLYSYNRRKREKYLRPFRNRGKRFVYKRWNHHGKPRKKIAKQRVKSKKVKDNSVTTQSFVIPSQSNSKSSGKSKHGKQVNKEISGYKPSPNFDENLETTLEEVHKNYDENIQSENVGNFKNYFVQDANLNEYVQKRSDCPDEPSSPSSSKSDGTSSKEDQNSNSDSTTIENFVVSSSNSTPKNSDDSADDDNGSEESLYESFPKMRRDVSFKIGYGNKNKGRDSSYPSEEDLVIEIPISGAPHTCNGEKLVKSKDDNVELTVNPDIVIKLRQNQQMSTEPSATDLSREKIVEQRMRLSKTSGSGINHYPDYKKDDPNTILQQRSAFNNPNKLRILLEKSKSRLDSRELSKSSVDANTTSSTTSVIPPTTLTTRHIETTTTTTLLTTKITPITSPCTTQSCTTKTTTTTRCGLANTTTRSPTTPTTCTTTKKSQGPCSSETTDSCRCSTKVTNLNQVLKHLKDDYISKIHDHCFTTASPGHHKGHKIGNGHVNPMRFYVCSDEKSSNSSKNCDSFYLCHSARPGRKTLKFKIPCPKGMGFDANLNKCTRNMGKKCKSIPRG